MAGGAWEYVMGVMTDSNGKVLSGRNYSLNSGFTGGYGEGGSLSSGLSWPEEKYYDKYLYGTDYLEYTRGHLGDATVEMGPFEAIIYANNEIRHRCSWNSSSVHFVYHTAPWFIRGGANYVGLESGIETAAANFGSSGEFIGFRVVLVP